MGGRNERTFIMVDYVTRENEILNRKGIQESRHVNKSEEKVGFNARKTSDRGEVSTFSGSAIQMKYPVFLVPPPLQMTVPVPYITSRTYTNAVISLVI